MAGYFISIETRAGAASKAHYDVHADHSFSNVETHLCLWDTCDPAHSLIATEYSFFARLFIQRKRLANHFVYLDKVIRIPSNELEHVEQFPSIVSLENKTVFMYSAIARNSSTKDQWDAIAVNGWQVDYLENQTFTCCLKLKNNTILNVTVNERNNFHTSRFRVKQYVCPIPGHSTRDLPTGISLASRQSSCQRDGAKYIRPVYPTRPKGDRDSLAVCNKFAFGNLSAASVIEWFEFHKLMGVDKVITYAYRLNRDALKVLRYYARNGPGEVHVVDLHDKSDFKLTLGLKNMKSYVDEQVAIFDCQDRLAGYTYMGLLDLDEYVTPKQHKNWKDMMAYLRKTFQSTAGFTFKTEVYVTSWGPVTNGSDISYGKFLNRTAPIPDRTRHCVGATLMPPQDKQYSSEKIQGKCHVPPEIATLKHYRSCRKEGLKDGGKRCYKDLQRITDTSMVQLASKVQAEVRRVKTLLNVS